MIQPQDWETWRMRKGDILINKRYANSVEVTSVDYKSDSQADFIRTNNPAIYGCAIALEDTGWHKE